MTQVASQRADVPDARLSVAEVAKRARQASRELARLSHDRRNAVLLLAAELMETRKAIILDANEKDRSAAEPAVRAGALSSAMFARLRLDERGIAEMAARVRDVVRLPDPLGRQLSATELDEGLVLYKETCPLGVIGIVFESRPDVISQVSSLTIKSANAVILKGGSETASTNEALVAIWREALGGFPGVGVPADAIQLLHSRSEIAELLSLDRDVDLIIPRGSKQLVELISRTSRVPVLGHGEGVCHVYVDRSADPEKALAVSYDAKVQYPAVCNAAETLLVHFEIAPVFLPEVSRRLQAAGVEIRACPRTLEILQASGLRAIPATEQDWSAEYSALILSVKVVDSLEDAIAHINRYGSRHTEAIVTEDREAAAAFMDEVDAAGVYQNASTRFADGFRYGLGAELGVSTNKLHARGPMGIEGLLTYKFKLYGQGHTVADYAKGAKQFHHRSLQ